MHWAMGAFLPAFFRLAMLQAPSFPAFAVWIGILCSFIDFFVFSGHTARFIAVFVVPTRSR
jgi:hypothetical protein